MDERAIDVVTISREYGAGGSELAQALGERLGWPVLDRELSGYVAERLGLDRRTVEAMDEHCPGLLARLATSLHVAPADAPLLVDTRDFLSPDAVAEAASATILEHAKSPPLVVVGHGAQCLLRGRAGTLHLRLVAPPEQRARRISERDRVDLRTAATSLKRVDDERAAYIRRYLHTDVTNPNLYDLQINTGRIPIPECADMVVEVVRASASRSAGADAAHSAV